MKMIAGILSSRRATSGPITLASDNFNRADIDPLDGNWSPFGGVVLNFQIVSNAATRLVATDDVAECNNTSMPNDQWSQCDITVTAGTTGTIGPGPACRMSTIDETGYVLILNDFDNLIYLFKTISAAFTQLASYPITYTAGGTVYLSVVGTTITTKYKGVTLGSITDASIASGKAGMFNSSIVTSFSIDNWSAGSI